MHPFLSRKPGSDIPSSPTRTRWWEFAGATVAAGAFAGAAQAETVQITLTGNQISNSLGNTLDTDLSGDGVEDLKSIRTGINSRASDFGVFLEAETLNDSPITAVVHVSTSSYSARIFGTTLATEFGFSPFDISALVPLAFTDARINAGAETIGLLEVRARNRSHSDHQISLLRLVFDDESTVGPTDAIVGGTKPEWVVPDVSLASTEISLQQRKLKKLKRLLRKAKRKGNAAAALGIRKKIKKLRASFRAL